MTESTAPVPVAPASGVLMHLLVVGGTVDAWASLSDADWATRMQQLGQVAARFGAQWVTIRPYAGGDGSDAGDRGRVGRREVDVDGCVVILDPTADGRQRFAGAMRELPDDESVNEASVAAALYHPAESEPDLVIVLGPSTALPPSLVWELAYAELVFSDVSWSDFDAAIVEDAIDEFSVRRRRFGGLDDE